MGKAKVESDDDAMDIEPPIIKAHKKIVKKTAKDKKTVIQKGQHEKKANIVQKLSKSVNLKKDHKPLQAKQQIFRKVVEGLKGKSGKSKKDQKKQRVLLKKEMRKHLDEEKIRRKSSDQIKVEQMDEEKPKANPEKFKKKEFDERAKVAEFQSLMGAGLKNIRNMVARNIGAN